MNLAFFLLSRNVREKDIDRKYQDLVNLPYADLKYQCSSNIACTGYAILALYEDVFDNHSFPVWKAVKLIKNSQQKYGGWDVFSEVGIRAGSKYTFRHFSTAWALKALLFTKNADYTDECVITGINYLAQLQDPYYGGWRSSLDADNYTWATCNALETVKLVKSQLAEVKSKQFLQIVCDWWDLRKKDSSFYIKIGKVVFAFNAAAVLLFSVIFTIMMFFVMANVSGAITAVLLKMGFGSEQNGKFTNGIVLVLGSFVIGLPWVVFVKNVFKKDMESWIDSIGWVYGIITGFLLAYYQFLL
jgi:squalene-hopene/tetraprenyl-beta-curcumene cyclase